MVKLILMLALGAAGAVPSSVRRFEEIAARSERLELKGIPAWMNGAFRIGADGRGHVRRRALGRSASVDASPVSGALVSRRYGRFTFTLSGAEVGGSLAGECRYARESVARELGPVLLSAPVAPLRLGCRFAQDGRNAGELELAAAPGPGVAGRLGVARWRGAELRLRSVHQLANARWPVEHALGYEMATPEGGVVGAVDVNGGSRARLALPRDPDLRGAALAAGTALALFWDPGDDED